MCEKWHAAFLKLKWDFSILVWGLRTMIKIYGKMCIMIKGSVGHENVRGKTSIIIFKKRRMAFNACRPIDDKMKE